MLIWINTVQKNAGSTSAILVKHQNLKTNTNTPEDH